jgi:exosortase H (IPTLxxWG-CTERM-specific)
MGTIAAFTLGLVRKQNEKRNPMQSQLQEFAAVWHRQRIEVRFCLLFAVFFALLYWLLIGAHGAESSWTIENIMTRHVVWVSGQVLALFGVVAQAEDTVLRTSRFGVRVLSGCNGVETILLYGAAVLAYPTSLRAKGIALLGGLPAIQIVNVARILGLLMIGQHWPTWFHEAHVFWAQGMMICLVAAVWFCWTERYGYKPAS